MRRRGSLCARGQERGSEEIRKMEPFKMNAKAGALADKQQLSPELVAVIDAFHEMKDALTKAQASIFQDGQMGLPARMVKPAATDPYHARRIALHAIRSEEHTSELQSR